MIVAVDTAVYPLDVVLRACHALSGRCSVAVRRGDGSAVEIEFTARDSADSLAGLPRELDDLLLDYTLRARIAEETRPIRELLVAQAFCEADLLDRRLVDADENDDPRGIAVIR
ncbi:MAG TPA: His-Xaa-Ser system protein HxsD [Thermoanaerobaculia bacterium]|nr:His-Xaa-Ser system protein HxsD [Thermoanaerobaculia bacterium]